MPHLTSLHVLFTDPAPERRLGYRGLLCDPPNTSQDALLPAVSKGEGPVAYLLLRRSGYSGYCRAFREYREWVAKRIKERSASPFLERSR